MLDDLFIEHQEQISLNCKTYQNIPILMSINQEFMQKLNDCIEAGISDYIVKPYTKEMLKLRIQHNLNLILLMCNFKEKISII